MTAPVVSIQCSQWSPGPRPEVGVCALGRYGGRPSLGMCAACPIPRGGESDQPARRSRGCGGCGRGTARADIVRWLGVRWIGLPAPLRLLRRRVLLGLAAPWAGCGCIYKLKLAVVILVPTIARLWRA